MGNLVWKKISFTVVQMEVKDLVNFAKEAQGVKEWDTPSLIRIGGLLAVKVNAIKNLNGQEKQKLICQVLTVVLGDIENKELNEPGKSEDDKKSIVDQFARLKKAVDDVVPASLELAISAARGKLDLRKVKMSVWVRYFSCCINSAVTVLVANDVISQAQAKQVTKTLDVVEEKASDAAAVYDSTTSASSSPVPAEPKMEFEQQNPMHATSQESATQESKSDVTLVTPL